MRRNDVVFDVEYGRRKIAFSIVTRKNTVIMSSNYHLRKQKKTRVARQANTFKGIT